MTKKCPYVHNTIEVVHQKDPRYTFFDVDNIEGDKDRLHITGNDSTHTRTRFFHDCLEGECAAYQHGRCVRKS